MPAPEIRAERDFITCYYNKIKISGNESLVAQQMTSCSLKSVADREKIRQK